MVVKCDTYAANIARVETALGVEVFALLQAERVLRVVKEERLDVGKDDLLERAVRLVAEAGVVLLLLVVVRDVW